MNENPFMAIIPREDEKVVGVNKQKIKELLAKAKNKWTIFIVSGDYGSGKSLILAEIEKALKGFRIEHMIYSKEMIAGVRGLKGKKKLAVTIDKFDLAETSKDESFRGVLDLIAEAAESGIIFLISTTPKILSRAFSLSQKFKNVAIVYDVPPLNYEEARELVVARLNEARTKKSESLEPLTEAELREIWRKSNGNPRMILLLCAQFYDLKRS
jgi:type II secretory pathway predicted ATPase ExeA